MSIFTTHSVNVSIFCHVFKGSFHTAHIEFAIFIWLFSPQSNVPSSPVFPQFDILPHGALQAYNGDNLTLDCGATGYPVPSIVWQRDGRPVDGSGQQNITITQNHSLVIQSLSPSQSGQYTCVAGSVVGVAYVSVQVEVVPRPPCE